VTDKIYTTADIAKKFGITKRAVQKYAKQHGIGKTMSGVYIFNKDDVGKFKRRNERRDNG
jgi:hypothetical protein